jgi:outer membrane receptor protein involved in Fe transport
LIVVTNFKPSLRQERAKILPLPKTTFQATSEMPQDTFTGLSWSNNQFSSTMQYRMSGRVFTDANNTTAASVNGVTGLLEGYHVFDLATEYKFKKNYNLKAGINNVFNEQYTTRRASGYPGPGILPEGQTFYLSVGQNFN